MGDHCVDHPFKFYIKKNHAMFKVHTLFPRRLYGCDHLFEVWIVIAAPNLCAWWCFPIGKDVPNTATFSWFRACFSRLPVRQIRFAYRASSPAGLTGPPVSSVLTRGPRKNEPEEDEPPRRYARVEWLRARKAPSVSERAYDIVLPAAMPNSPPCPMASMSHPR